MTRHLTHDEMVRFALHALATDRPDIEQAGPIHVSLPGLVDVIARVVELARTEIDIADAPHEAGSFDAIELPDRAPPG